MEIQTIINNAKKRLAKEANLRTPASVLKEAEDLKIYQEYKQLLAKPGAMKEAVKAKLMKKYKISAPSTIWAIEKRVEKRLGIKSEN